MLSRADRTGPELRVEAQAGVWFGDHREHMTHIVYRYSRTEAVELSQQPRSDSGAVVCK